MKQKIESLQVVRCFAAIQVAICHIWNDGWLPSWFVDLGGFGVDVFFVLSGFIMSLTVKTSFSTKSENSSYFLKKRLVRIFPTYLICAIPLILFNIKAEGWKNLFFYIGNLLLLPSFTNEAGYHLVLGPGWSLVYEMMFYYLFAFVLLFVIKKEKLLLACGGILTAVVLFVLFSGLQGSQMGWVNFQYIIGDTLLINFVLGIVCYFIFDRYKDTVKIPFSFCLTGFVLFLFFAAYINQLHTVSRFVAYGIPSFLIVLSFSFSQLNNKNPVLSTLVFLGDASYSIYLFQYYGPFFKNKVMLLNNFLHLDKSLYLNLADIFLLLSVILLGCFLYKHLEKPIIKRLTSVCFKKS